MGQEGVLGFVSKMFTFVFCFFFLKGDAGYTGDHGAKGISGEAGERGERGAIGITGAPVSRYVLTLCLSDYLLM